MKDLRFGSAEDYYKNIYEQSLYGSGLSSWLMKQTHKKIEKGTNGKFYQKVLEIGSGTGQHLDHVIHSFDDYYCLEVEETSLRFPHSTNPAVIKVQGNADEIPFPDSTFHRVISTCVLHHVENPEAVLSELRRVLESQGQASIYLSCDPSILVRTLRRFTSARKARKLGFTGYPLLIAREHRNHFLSLREITRYVFKDDLVKERYYPSRINVWSLNAFVVFDVIKNAKE